MTEEQITAANKQIAGKIADKVLTNLAKDKEVNLSVAGKEDIKGEVIRETTSVIMNQTNQEPWYQSRIILAQYVTLIVGMLGVFGVVIEPEYKELIITTALAIGSLVNPLFTLYARFIAKKPLGH